MSKNPFAVRDEAAECLYGVGDSDGELPALELWLREQSRLMTEMEVQNEETVWSMTADPADILEMLEEAALSGSDDYND